MMKAASEKSRYKNFSIMVQVGIRREKEEFGFMKQRWDTV